MENQDPSVSTQIFHLADRVLSIVVGVLLLMAVVMIGLLSFYFYFVTEGGISEASAIQSLVLTFWSELMPFATSFLQLIGPAFLFLFALGFIVWISQSEKLPFDTTALFSDLPSVLALLIISTICLLPLARIEVPSVLSNVALVVVGFYFGRRQTTNVA